MQPYCGNIMSIKIPHKREGISLTLLTLSGAAIALLLLASPLLHSNLLLQPAQAQTLMSFRTPTPAGNATANDHCFLTTDVTLTFDAQGTPSSSSPYRLENASGTFKVTDSNNETRTYSGSLTGGTYSNNSGGGAGHLELFGNVDDISKAANCPNIRGGSFLMSTPCSTSNDDGTLSSVTIVTGEPLSNNFKGVVECSPSQGGENATTTTAQPSSSSSSSSSMTGTTTSTQDRDADGILDANDNCPNLPNTRCYKEGDTALVVHNSNR